MERDYLKLFVFGTLKHGFALHDQGLRGAAFLGGYCTAQVYPMVVAGPWYAPTMINTPGAGKRVTGELYVINAEQLAALDESVDKPGNYRLDISVIPEAGGSPIRAMVYMKATDLQCHGTRSRSTNISTVVSSRHGCDSSCQAIQPRTSAEHHCIVARSCSLVRVPQFPLANSWRRSIARLHDFSRSFATTLGSAKVWHNPLDQRAEGAGGVFANAVIFSQISSTLKRQDGTLAVSKSLMFAAGDALHPLPKIAHPIGPRS
ncbi:gamma-glutamylcyclotransferase family protein [Mesorhizobium sp. ORM8.1]